MRRQREEEEKGIDGGREGRREIEEREQVCQYKVEKIHRK